MNVKPWLILTLALGAAAAPGAAFAQDAGPGTFTVRNDTDQVMECAIKKAGSGVSEDVVLNPGQTWTHAYPKAKPRNFRCLGAAPIWYIMHAGLIYRIAPNRDGLIVLVPAGRRQP
jgi:hypothetical protein